MFRGAKANERKFLMIAMFRPVRISFSRRLLGATTLLTCLASALSAGAAVEPVAIRINENASYEVPAGKALLIETIAAEGDGSGWIFLRFVANGTATECRFGTAAGIAMVGTSYSITANNYWVSFERPLKIPAGARVEHGSQDERQAYSLFGLLIDADELYAAAPTSPPGPLLAKGGRP